MAKLSLTIVPGKTLNDGKHKVRFAVVHNSQTRRIITDQTGQPDIWRTWWNP